MPLKPIITKGRLEIIKTDPKRAYNYSHKVLHKRWSEAEPYIMKNATYAYLYAQNVIKGTWPEAEPYIMKNPASACHYALYILGHRWPEAEPYIMKDGFYSSLYSRIVK